MTRQYLFQQRRARPGQTDNKDGFIRGVPAFIPQVSTAMANEPIDPGSGFLGVVTAKLAFDGIALGIGRK